MDLPANVPALDRYQRIDVATPCDGDGRFARRMGVFRRPAATHTLDTLQPNRCVVGRFAADARRSTGVCLMTEWHVGPSKRLCTGRTVATCRPAPACGMRRWLAARAPAPCSARVRADGLAPRCAAPRPGWRPLNYAGARRAQCRRCDGDDAAGGVGGAGGVFSNSASNGSASPPAHQVAAERTSCFAGQTRKSWSRMQSSLTVSIKAWHYTCLFILHVRNDGCKRTV